MYIVVLNLESVDEILWYYHSYYTSLGALSIAAIRFKYLTELNLAFFWGTLSDPKVLPYGIVTCLKFYPYLGKFCHYTVRTLIKSPPGYPLFSKMKEWFSWHKKACHWKPNVVKDISVCSSHPLFQQNPLGVACHVVTKASKIHQKPLEAVQGQQPVLQHFPSVL